jgi:hypothetical protein
MGKAEIEVQVQTALRDTKQAEVREAQVRLKQFRRKLGLLEPLSALIDEFEQEDTAASARKRGNDQVVKLAQVTREAYKRAAPHCSSTPHARLIRHNLPKSSGAPHYCYKTAKRQNSIDTRNSWSGKALGIAVSIPKSIDTRKSNPRKGMTTCRHFWGV